MSIIPDRLNWLDTLELASGGHQAGQDKFCALEAAAYIAGERWSDHPTCVDPVIAAFGRSWNDGLPDADRTRLLKPFIVRMIGTASTPEIQDQRAFMAADWAVRVFTPTWLRRAGLSDDATALEALPDLSSTDLCKAAMPIIAKARRSAVAAGDAAWDAAWAAAQAAAQAAAWAAAQAAAQAAVQAAARDAAWAAAQAAVEAAAGAAAWAAAWAVLGDTVVELQASASDLLDRMIKLTEVK